MHSSALLEWHERHLLICRYHDHQRIVQNIWSDMSRQLQQCSACVNEYHSAQVMAIA